MLRTHHCGELRTEHAGQTVTLCGWVDAIRDLGGANFILIRDRYGRTQTVVGTDVSDELNSVTKSLRFEFVVKVVGVVEKRPQGQENPQMDTGDIEVRVLELEILNSSDVPPFLPSQVEVPGEDLRLKHRYIDLRRREMQQTLLLRSRIIKSMRDYFEEHRFIDVETPILEEVLPRVPEII